MESLTTKEAFRAMYYFLEKKYEMTNSDDLGGLLGGMSLHKDGTTVDPAAWDDWIESVNKAIASSDDDIRLNVIF